MNTSARDVYVPLAADVKLTRDVLNVRLSDGRSISAPLAWYPRLLHASTDERNDWRLIGNGRGIHWEALDEDISIEGLLFGHRSAESQESLARWFASRPMMRSRRHRAKASAAKR